MKFCFVYMEGALGSHCSVTRGGLRLVLCSIPRRTGILGCLSSALLLYLGKDISRVQLFPLINTALGRPLLRRLLRKSAHCENLLPGSGIYQISAKHRILDLYLSQISNRETLFQKYLRCRSWRGEVMLKLPTKSI